MSQETTNNPYYEEYYSAADTVFMFEGENGLVPFEQIVNFQFAINNSKGPVFGYFSEDYDAIARGTRIVQGQFAVAMKDVYDLNRILGISNPEIDRSDYIAMKDAKNPNKIYDEWIGDGFNISIKFGSYVDVDKILTELKVTEKERIAYRNGTTLDIIDVHINNTSQYIDANDSTCLMLIYSFFAKMAPIKKKAVTNYIPMKDKNKITEEPIIEQEEEKLIKRINLVLDKDAIINIYNAYKLEDIRTFNNCYINIFSNDYSEENYQFMIDHFPVSDATAVIADTPITDLMIFKNKMDKIMYSIILMNSENESKDIELVYKLIEFYKSYYDVQNIQMKKELKKIMLLENINSDEVFRSLLVENLT